MDNSDLTKDFITGPLTSIMNEINQVNKYNNPTVPVYGVYINTIFKSLYKMCYNIQSQYNVVIYNPFAKDDTYWFNNQLYVHGNQISFQNLIELGNTMDRLQDAVDYISSSSVAGTNQSYLDLLNANISRVNYALQFVTRYLNPDDAKYGNVSCNFNTTNAKYGFNALEIYCG